MKNYRALFSLHVGGDLLEVIRAGANKGMAFGHDCFKNEIEVLTGGRLSEANKRPCHPINHRYLNIT